MSGVDVLGLLRKIASGEGDVELMAMRCHAAIAELIEASEALSKCYPDASPVYHVMQLRAALAAVSPK